MKYPSGKAAMGSHQVRHYVMTLMYMYWYNQVDGAIYEKLNEVISDTMIPKITLSFLELKDWMHKTFNTNQFDVYIAVDFVDRRAGVDIHPQSPAFMSADMMEYVTQQHQWLDESESAATATDSEDSSSVSHSDGESEYKPPATQRKVRPWKRRRRRY